MPSVAKARATLRISSQPIANWLALGVLQGQRVRGTFATHVLEPRPLPM